MAGLRDDPLTALGRIRDHLRSAIDGGAFDLWRGQAITENSKSTLLAGDAFGGRWKVQLFRLADGKSQPPHCHDNLASCLVVIDGRLRMREFDRLRRRETDEAAMLQVASDDVLGPDHAILTSEDHRNAHWFGAVGGPALAVNFKASGYFRRELLRLRNRRYLDPSNPGEGPFLARFITSAEAKSRFADRPP